MFVVTDLAGNAVAELQVIEHDFTDQLNNGDMGTFTFGYSREAEPYLHPWRGMIGVEVAGSPIWLGVVTKRSGSITAGSAKVTAMQLEGYLDMVWLTDVYDDGGLLDASRMVAKRIGQLRTYLGGRSNPRVMLPTNTPADCGIEVEYEWASPYDGLSWGGEPSSVLADIRQADDFGVRWFFQPREALGKWAVDLAVGAAPSVVSRHLQVGYDVPGLTVEEDGTLQASDWLVVGDAGDMLGKASSDAEPVIMKSRSLKNVADQGLLDATAQQLLKSAGSAVVSGTDIELIGTYDIRAGELVEVFIPQGMFQNWPDGRVWNMRVESVSWSGSAAGARTKLALVQPSDDLTALTAPRTLVRTLRGLESAVTALALRR